MKIFKDRGIKVAYGSKYPFKNELGKPRDKTESFVIKIY